MIYRNVGRIAKGLVDHGWVQHYMSETTVHRTISTTATIVACVATFNNDLLSSESKATRAKVAFVDNEAT